MTFPVTEHIVKTARHTTFYLSCGSPERTPIIFVHGWPELSISWRHQLPCFGALGFHAVAPDMRGYGRSGAPREHKDYAMEEIVQDMIELIDALGQDRAVWVGHDWGSPVVWNLASHHPERCHGVASLCVPYFPGGSRIAHYMRLVDRSVYPQNEFPAGQWEYILFYSEQFEKAQAVFEANVQNTVKALFRSGSPRGLGKPSRTAFVRKDGGWFGGAAEAPEMELDTKVMTEEDLSSYVAALERTGFFGPGSYYVNDELNASYSERAKDGGKLTMPVLFLHGVYDQTCQTVTSSIAEPMRGACSHLSEVFIDSGHWMAQEKPAEVNASIAHWLATEVPQVWLRKTTP